MKHLVYYHPIALKEKHPIHKCINPLISVLDRSGASWPLIDLQYLNMFPMPEAKKSFDFHSLSMDRIDKICSGNSVVTLLWSGGIDSTYILCLMLESGIAHRLLKEKRLRIALNNDSIRENPKMYENLIKKDFMDAVIQSDSVLTDPRDYGNIITGEMADNLVGSLTMKSCVDYYNDFSVVHEPWRDRALEWFTRNLDKSDKDTAVEFLEWTSKFSQAEILTSHDLFWFLNFNCKWQAVNFRIVSHCSNEQVGNDLIDQLVHFFNTEEFQCWSILEGHYFSGNSWSDYKMIMKRFIFSVTNDQDYFKYKTKHPSLPSLLRFKDTFDFIYKDDQDRYYFTKEPLEECF